MATIEELETVHTEELSPITVVSAGDIVAPAPLDISNVDVTSKFTAKTVNAGAISAFSLATPDEVTYDKISTDEEVTNETLNRTAETLAQSVNEKLGAWSGVVSTSVNGLRDETDSAITTLVGNINAQLTQLKAEGDSQVEDINVQIDALIDDMNSQMQVIRVKNGEQSALTAAKLNEVSGQLSVNIEKVKNIADNAQLKIAALDDVYKTDAEAAARIQAVNDLITSLNGADLDFIQAVDGAIDELNAISRIQAKSVVMNSSTGVYNFNTANEGFGEFLAATDYEVSVEVIDNDRVESTVVNKTENGFDISCISKGVHFRPQPHDGSVTPVTLSVTLVYHKRNPLTFNVDTLNTSFVTDGAGTDENTVGAEEE